MGTAIKAEYSTGEQLNRVPLLFSFLSALPCSPFHIPCSALLLFLCILAILAPVERTVIVSDLGALWQWLSLTSRVLLKGQ